MYRYNLLTLMTLAVICVVSAQIYFPPPQNCSANENYSPCGHRCEPTCADIINPRNDLVCSGYYIRGMLVLPWLRLCYPPMTEPACRCNTSFVRNNGTCIPSANCTTS